MPVAIADLPALELQAERLIDLGLHEKAGLTAGELRVAAFEGERTGGLLVIHPDLLRPSELAPLMEHAGKPGFVVEDMTDIDEFCPIEAATPPEGSIYVVDDPQRGDDMANWSPDEALPALLAAGRSPLTLTEGIHWLLQQPPVLERGHCFMTIGSRLEKSTGVWDSRVPALWISNGTGRDGRARRDAPKVGWCWAGNRHTWLGFASAAGRRGMPADD